jgi:hypothetical protein
MIHRELHLSCPSKDSRDLVELICNFARAHPDYDPLPEHTERYRIAIEADAVVLHAIYRDPFPSINLASSDGATLYVTNIVPMTRGEMTTREYNEFLAQFSCDLSKFFSANSAKVRLRLTSDELSLESAISGKRTRAYFAQYLANHPTSYHFFDVRRLDRFICVASRYKRGRVDPDRIFRYLTESLKWSSEDAKWCSDRIRTGLEILEANKES